MKKKKTYSDIINNLPNYSDIVEYALKLKGKEQKKFVEAFAKTGKYALTNIGYVAGYYDSKTAAKIHKVFSTSHPVFGKLKAGDY